MPSLKDIQVGKGGTKNPACKIPITQKVIELTSKTAQSPSRFTIGFCLNDHTENKTAILPTKVHLFGGNNNSLLKIGEMTPIEDQFFQLYGVKLFGINLNESQYQGLHSLQRV